MAADLLPEFRVPSPGVEHRFLGALDDQTLTLQLLQKIDRRQTLIESRLGNIERLLAHPCKPWATFPQFSHLPAEIRCLIWEMAIPRRKLHDYKRKIPAPHLRDPFSGFTARSPCLSPPAVAQVCRESRKVAKRRGDLFPVRFSWDKSQRLYWTWFDGSRDVLELSLYGWLLPLGHSIPMNILRRAETIVVHMEHVEPCWVNAIFRDKKVRQTLRTINIQMQFPKAVHKTNWNPDVFANVFDIDSVAMVDVESFKELGRLNRLLSQNPSIGRHIHSGRPDQLRGHRSDRRSDHSSEADLCCEGPKEVFAAAWLFGGDDKLEADNRGKDGGINIGIPWIQESLRSMPRLRWVYIYEMAEDVNPALPFYLRAVRGSSSIGEESGEGSEEDYA
jgi:hypothetical protein